jgi:hypothetical protein
MENSEELIASRMNVNLIDIDIDFIKQNMDTFYKTDRPGSFRKNKK